MSVPTVHVLDTNVLLYAPESLYAFPDSEVVVPIVVVEEIDRFKGELSETGHNARKAAETLDALRESGSLADGVALPQGGRLRVEFQRHLPEALPGPLDPKRSSNRVLAVAWGLQQSGEQVVLVTQDTNLRVRASALGVPVIRYANGRDDFAEAYAGFRIISVERAQLQELERTGGLRLEPDLPLQPNEGVLLHSDQPDAEALTLYEASSGQLRKLEDGPALWGMEARNPEQRFALHLLIDPAIAIVTLSGKAGTGKTLLALASGLHSMLMEQRYSRILVSRPIFPMGRDLGYLPGEVQDKLAPWMQPIFDNLELLIHQRSDHRKGRQGYQELIDQGLLIIEPLTYIRGRSIPNQYMIVDEAQNLTPHEMKTIVTRVGEGTKIILTGDPHQIDNPYVNSASNGLSTLVERFKSHPIAGHVTLRQGERSELAELAANLF